MLKETPKIPLIGGVIAAIGATLCCAVPMVLIALGMGGSWASARRLYGAYTSLVRSG